ncbi:hypothetical protein G6F64_015026 [Rhizopus arrhizus]|uniref:Uncharacterized protein n=1 Tax=Rhizopus oryzae TaxID=64495 RepID=A0A9P6WSB0_RHIOR|nr:hypothetical protein G6F64_015026 [Rhizopus arrhizus]
MCAQGRQVAEQGVGQGQEMEAGVQVAAHVAGLTQHVRQRGGQRRVGVVHVAAGDAVGQVVAHAAAVLAQHRVQVTCGGVQHARQHQVQLAALPVGQDQERRRRCDRTAQHG